MAPRSRATGLITDITTIIGSRAVSPISESVRYRLRHLLHAGLGCDPFCGRGRMANATFHFSYPSHLNVSNPFNPMTNSPSPGTMPLATHDRAQPAGTTHRPPISLQ